MVNISSAVKKNTGTKHTRKELMNKSPVPWVVILIITAIGGGIFVYPDVADWMQKSGELSEMEISLPQLESQRQSLTIERDQLNEVFEEKAKPFLVISDQRFPDVIDTTKVAQIMEIYSILMQINNRGNQVELKTLSISQPQNVDGEPFAQSTMNLNLSIDREMLQEYVKFIQTGEISEELENEVLEKGGGETASVEFLTLNKLPVSTISSMSLNEEGNSSGDSEIYNVQIQVLLHSSPV